MTNFLVAHFHRHYCMQSSCVAECCYHRSGGGGGQEGGKLHIVYVVTFALSALFLCSFCHPLLLGLSYRGSAHWFLAGSCLPVVSSGSRQWVSRSLPPRHPLSLSPHTPPSLTCSYCHSMGCRHLSVGLKVNMFLFTEVSNIFYSSRQVFTVPYWLYYCTNACM